MARVGGTGTDPTLIEVLERSRSLGFLGPGPVSRHVEHALALGLVAGEPEGCVMDLGAGGGVPGLVLARSWPQSRWALLDAGERRVAFLELAVERLGLSTRAQVVRDRAERTSWQPEHREAYELVVARSFGSPAVTAECASALVEVGGRIVVSEPPESDFAQRWPAEPLAVLGLVARAAEGSGFHFTVLEKVAPSPADMPRKVGASTRRPLF